MLITSPVDLKVGLLLSMVITSKFYRSQGICVNPQEEDLTKLNSYGQKQYTMNMESFRKY